MVLVCWGMVGKSYGQNESSPSLAEKSLAKVWDKTFGSTGKDNSYSIAKSIDGGFIVVGISSSNAGADKSENTHGGQDIWILKINDKGEKLWDKTFGGSGAETKPSVIAIPSGGYIVAATSASAQSGNKSSNNFGNTDYWLFKVDEEGNKLWDKTFGGLHNEVLSDIILCKDGNFLIAGTSASGIGGSKTEVNRGSSTDVWLVKIDSNGNKLWDKTIGGGGQEILYSVAEIGVGFILLCKSYSYDGIGEKTTPEQGSWIVKVDINGNKLWDRHYSDLIFSTAALSSDNSIVMIGRYDERGSAYIMFRIDQNGAILLRKGIGTIRTGGTRNDGMPCIYSLSDDKILFSMSSYTLYSDTSPLVYKSYDFFLINYQGEIIWKNRIFGVDDGSIEVINSNEIIFCGSFYLGISGIKSDISRGNDDYWILKLRNPLATRNEIKGNIYNDLNTNCQLNPNETGLRNILVRATPGNYNTFTDDKGNYTLYLDDIGTYTVTPIIPTSKQNIITSVCNPNSQTVSFTSLGNIKNDVNFGLKAPNCASLTVDISSNRRRRCFRNFTTVKYANEGYAAAENVQLKVIYPQYVVPIRSSVAWTSRQDSVITYNLGRLAAGQTGQIVITDSVICGNESIRGLTQCTKAIISPKSTCLANNPNWDKADLQAFSQCVGAKNVKLSVVNTGEAMRDSTAWRLFLNGVLKQQGRLKLGKGENYSFEILAKGNTVRLEADQTPNHPIGRYALTTIERCGGVVAFSAVLPPPSVQLPINMGASGEEIATSCMPIIDSYDPNDKQVIPAGVGASNIVRDSDELEFQVRFQNTGTDTAYTVIIRDTLSTALDIASLQIGASSHYYTYTVSGKNNPIITWTFNNINLPAQKQDDAGSNGFVKFKIAQMPNNAKGTKIRNKAGIYFDFNSPIITNETNLTVGDLVSDLNNAADLATIFVCNTKPQPTSSQAGADQITVADSLVLSANIAEKGTGSWKVVQGTGEFANANNPKTTVKKIGLGENIYEWSVNLCNTISASKVKITKVTTPKAEITSKGDTLIAEIADSYQWFLNGQAISGATSQSFIAKTNGTYTVEIKKFGVTVISPAFKHTITSIEDELLQKSTSLIPNPAQNTCVLQVRNEYVGEVKVSISNLLGQIVFQAIAEKNTTILDYSLDLQHFTNGIYFVYLQTVKGKVVKKLVKM